MAAKLKHKIFFGGGFEPVPPLVPSFILMQDNAKILTQESNNLIQQDYAG